MPTLNRSIKSPSRWLAISLSAIFCIMLLINLFTPLRLNVDATRYFNIMLFIKKQIPADDPAAHDFFPHGYPMLLAGMETLHMLKPWLIVALNMAALLVAGYFISKLLDIKRYMVIIAALLLSYINIKHLTLPVADEIFTGCTIAALYCWTMAFKRIYWYYPLAILLTLVSIELRTAGIVIIAGLLLYAIIVYKQFWVGRPIRLIIVCIIMALCIGLFCWKLPSLEKTNDYFRQLDMEALLKQPSLLFNRLGTHFREIGEFFLNIPSDKIQGFLKLRNAGLVNWAFIAVGIAAFSLIIFAFIKYKVYKTPAGCFFIGYLLMIFSWPFPDERFLIPAIPFFLVCLYKLYLDKKPAVLKLVTGIFILMGIASIVYSDVLSVSQSKFLKFYSSDHELSTSYKMHFQKGHQAPDINQQRVLFILDNYDR